MGVEEVINELDRNGKVFVLLLNGLSLDVVTWKSKPEDWCILEIVCHLVDEEKEDFRARVKLSLETPNGPLVPIAPEDWPRERNYLGQDFKESLERWERERLKSIAWLKALPKVNWENAINHPKFGRISARSFLCNWLAHDYHHIRQINNLKYSYFKVKSGDSLSYAGNW
ncbi:MAG: DinB family protein [Flavobacteriaceae bacterium]